MPRVSVIIPAFDAEATIGQTLASVEAQSFADWEAIVVDDGSRDATAALAAGASRRDPRIRLVRQANAGLSNARNRGIEEAGGDALLFLDADDEIAPGHLERLTSALDESGADVAYCGYRRVTSNGRSLPPVFNADIAVSPFHAFAHANKVAVHSVLVPRGIVRAVEGFDPKLTTCEDWDLWLRLARTGARFVGVPEPLALYHMRATSMSRDFERLAKGALEVLARARRTDDRVSFPAPEHAAGVADSYGKAATHFLLWAVVAAAAAGRNMADPFSKPPGADLAGDAAALIETILDALAIGAESSQSELARQWLRVVPIIEPMLQSIEAASSDKGLARRVIYALERDLVREDPLLTPLPLSTVHAVRVELGGIGAVEANGADLLHLRIIDADGPLFTHELPLWGDMSARDVAGIAAEAIGRDKLLDPSVLSLSARTAAHLARHARPVIARAARGRFRSARSELRSLRNAAWVASHSDQVSGRPSSAVRDAIVGRANETTADLTPVSVDAGLKAGHPPGDFSAAYWERFFENRADPFDYDNDYEQHKYRLTLSLIDGLRIDRALEAACAEGHFTALLAPRVGSLVAADVAETALTRARDRCLALDNVAFQRVDLNDGGLPSGFDLTVCSEVLYFMQDEKGLARAARALRDTLNPGGLLLSAHSTAVQDQPDATGFDWGFPFGARKIAETFEAIGGLALERSLRSDLFRIDLWRRTGEAAVAVVPELVEAGTPKPEIYRTIRWGGVVARAEELCQRITTREVPVLMYHMIADSGPDALARYRTAPAAFEEQLRQLRRHGFYGLTCAELDWYRVRGEALPGRPILITFDDGYRDFADTAWPILFRNDFRAEVFLVTDKVGGTSDWDRRFGEPQPLMDWGEIAALKAQGVAFGSHLATHTYVDSLTSGELLREAVASRLTLERRLGAEVRAIAPPSGGLDERAIRIFDEAGYHLCFSTREGIASIDQNSLNLPRIEVFGGMSLDAFASAVGLA